MVLNSQSCSEQDELSFLQQILAEENITNGENESNTNDQVLDDFAPWDNSWTPLDYLNPVNLNEILSSPVPTKKEVPATQNIQFVDHVCSPTVEIGNKESTCCKTTKTKEPRTKKKLSVDKPIDIEKSRIAQQRKRDKRGQFLRSEVANRLEELENQLACREYECDSLRLTLTQRDVELEALKHQFQRLLSERANQQRYLQQVSPVNQPVGSPYCQMSPVSPYPIQTTSRNFSLVPSPNPTGPVLRAPFKEKIDYTKIQLRKTDSYLDDEKREVLNSQEQWEERQRMREFMQKMEEEVRWQQYHYPSPPLSHQSGPTINPYFGGAPSNIYPETQNKVGNLPVPAFTTKVDLQNKRQELGRRPSERSLERLLTEEQNQLLASSKARIFQDDPMKPYGAPVLVRNSQNLISPRNYSNSASNTIDLTHAGEMDLDNTTQSTASGKPLGGPPSNIYGPPEKKGNLRVPAFTTKIDYSGVSLRKTLPHN